MRLLRILPLILFPLIFDPAFGQDDFINDSIKHPPVQKKKDPFWDKDKVVFGGTLGILFGDPTYVDVSPTIGYKVFPRLIVGCGPLYNYFYSRRYDEEYNIYGGRVFLRPNITENIFLYGEYELLSVNYRYMGYKLNYTISGLLAGGGYQQSEDGGFFILALWEVLRNDGYPYPNPIIRMGFTVGI